MQYLKEQLIGRIKSVNAKRIHYRRASYSLFLLSTLLSAFTTVILGLDIPELSEEVRITALIVSAVIIFLNAFNAFFSNKELWVANNVARNRLYKLKFDIEFAEAENVQLTPEIKEQFKDIYQQILDDLNSTWQKGRLGS